MRPRPSELIGGVRSILKETIEPELSSEHAKARLREVRALLAQVDWDEAGFTLVRRNESLRAGLESLDAWRLEDPIRHGIEAPPLPEESDASFSAQQDCYEALASNAVIWVRELSTWTAHHGADPSVDRMLRVLAAAL
jgi:hypothetical protein